MRNVLTSATAAAIFGAAALFSSSASAAIACNREGECWHTAKVYSYHPEYGVTIHESNWRWGPSEHFTWREHTGRGYWRNGVWIRF